MRKKDIAPRQFIGPTRRKRKGLLILYTGEGKGKTTAAFGAVFRSLGRGLRVAVVQFIKGKWISGEIKALEKFGEQVEFHSVGDGFTWDTQNFDQDVASAKKGWEKCIQLLRKSEHDVYLFDELIYVLKYRFLTLNEILKGLKNKDPKAHIILTGRDAPKSLIKRADLVTEMKEIKHPYQKGLIAQPGIDY